MLSESIKYTYIHCSPSRDDGANEKNRKLVKKLKNKIRELGEIIAIQETEIEFLKKQKPGPGKKDSELVKRLRDEN